MKKIILIALIASVTMGAYSAPKIVDYVVTDDGITYFTKIRHGLNDFLIGKTEDGKKIKFSADEIKSYRKSGEVYHKKQIFINGELCENCKFLKLMTLKNGCGMYMLQSYEGDQLVSRFYVYKGDKYVLEVNYDNYVQMFDFFGI